MIEYKNTIQDYDTMHDKLGFEVHIDQYMPSSQHYWAVVGNEDKFIVIIDNARSISGELLAELLFEGYILVEVSREQVWVNDEWQGYAYTFVKKPFGLY